MLKNIHHGSCIIVRAKRMVTSLDIHDEMSHVTAVDNCGKVIERSKCLSPSDGIRELIDKVSGGS